MLLADLHDDVGVHLDEPAVAVIGPAGVAGPAGHDLDDLLVQAEVEDRVHHAGHRRPRARAHGDEQRGLPVAEALAGERLQPLDVRQDLLLELRGDGPPVLIVPRAGLGGDGEALGDGQADAGHLGQVRALAAQQLAHVGAALGEEVYILMCHIVFAPFPFSVRLTSIREMNKRRAETGAFFVTLLDS